jgi:hypothetical protein
MTELDVAKLGELAKDLGYWPASTDEESLKPLGCNHFPMSTMTGAAMMATGWRDFVGVSTDG